MGNADRIAQKYQDVTTANRYEVARAKKPAWHREQQAITEFLLAQPLKTCLDVPVGTGRFFELYARHGIHVTGVDISKAMIDIATSAAEKLGIEPDMHCGSVFHLPFPDRSFDAVICWRLLNWLSPKELERAVSEVVRVSDGWVLASIRQRQPTVRSWAAERKRWLLRATGRYASFGHREGDVRKVFDRLGVTVHERHVVNSRPGYMEHIGWVLHR